MNYEVENVEKKIKFNIENQTSLKNYIYKNLTTAGYFLPDITSHAVSLITLLSMKENVFVVLKKCDFVNLDVSKMKLCFSLKMTWEVIASHVFEKEKKHLPFFKTPDKRFIKKIVKFFDPKNTMGLQEIEENPLTLQYYKTGNRIKKIRIKTKNKFKIELFKKLLKKVKKIKKAKTSLNFQKITTEKIFNNFKLKYDAYCKQISFDDKLYFLKSPANNHIKIFLESEEKELDFRYVELSYIQKNMFGNSYEKTLIEIMKLRNLESRQFNKKERGYFYSQSEIIKEVEKLDLAAIYKERGQVFIENLLEDENFMSFTPEQKVQLAAIKLDIDNRLFKMKEDLKIKIVEQRENLDKDKMLAEKKSYHSAINYFNDIIKNVEMCTTYNLFKDQMYNFKNLLNIIGDCNGKKKEEVTIGFQKIFDTIDFKKPILAEYDLNIQTAMSNISNSRKSDGLDSSIDSFEDEANAQFNNLLKRQNEETEVIEKDDSFRNVARNLLNRNNQQDVGMQEESGEEPEEENPENEENPE